MAEIPGWILCIVITYLFGAVPAAYLAVKWRYGKDLRHYGSGQVGGSNVYRSFSKKLGIAVGIYDILKGVLVVGIARLLNLDTAHQVAMGLATIIGHNWSVFLRFDAGRGVATSIGVGLILFPLGIPGFLFLALLTILVGSSPLPVLAAMASLPLTSWVLNEPPVMTLGLLALFLILVVRRLTVPRSERAKGLNTWRLLLNRFLFDRDIRDAKTWIYYKPSVQTENNQTEHR
jgi:acyl phosphate:glycerol-3-phosphate acyltransferase